MKTITGLKVLLIISLLICSGKKAGASDDFKLNIEKWNKNKASVFKTAEEQNKYIFLLVGRETCGNCQKVVEHLSEEPLKSHNDQNYVLWYSMRDDPASKSEVKIYTEEYDKVADMLPFIYIIDPANPNEIVVSEWGYQDVTDLKKLLDVNPMSNTSLDDLNTEAYLLHSKLVISNHISEEQINVFTIAGQFVASYNKRDLSVEIDASEFPSGTLVINSNKGWNMKVMNALK